MAIILLGAMVADARGKAGGIVYSRNRGGHYIRTKISPIQPQTANQIAIRTRLTQVAQYYRDTLTAAQRAAWKDYADSTPLVNRLGNKQHLSAIAMFSRFNAQWLRSGGSVLAAAPTTPGEAAMESVGLTGAVADGIKATTPVPALVVGHKLMVYACAAPVSQAKEFFNGPWVYIANVDSTTVFPFVLVAGASLAVGQRWFFRFKLFSVDGRVGPTSYSKVDIVA